MRNNVSDISEYLKRVQSYHHNSEKDDLSETVDSFPDAQPEELPDLDDILWLYGDEYTVNTQTLEIIIRNYIKGLENRIQENESSNDRFRSKLLKESLTHAEDLQIRLLALMAYDAQLENEAKIDENNDDPDDLPF